MHLDFFIHLMIMIMITSYTGPFAADCRFTLFPRSPVKPEPPDKSRLDRRVRGQWCESSGLILILIYMPSSEFISHNINGRSRNRTRSKCEFLSEVDMLLAWPSLVLFLFIYVFFDAPHVMR